MTRDELLRKWVDALESGKYEQGTGVLRTQGDRYCCLGVLCDVSTAGKWKLDEEGDYVFRAMKGNSSHALLPDGVLDLGRDQIGEYMGMNDTGESFAAIAAQIRANNPDVFAVSV